MLCTAMSGTDKVTSKTQARTVAHDEQSLLFLFKILPADFEDPHVPVWERDKRNCRTTPLCCVRSQVSFQLPSLRDAQRPSLRSSYPPSVCRWPGPMIVSHVTVTARTVAVPDSVWLVGSTLMT